MKIIILKFVWLKIINYFCHVFPRRKRGFENTKKKDTKKYGTMKIMTTRQGDVKKIAKLYGITPRSVNNALRYRVGGDRAEKIRRTALAMGAVQVG